MSDLKNYVILAMVALCMVLGLSTSWYRKQLRTANNSLEMLNTSVERQNKEASDRYEALEKTAKETSRQLGIATGKIKQDGEAHEKALADLKREYAERPPQYRVRLVPGSCGAGGGSAQGGLTAGAGQGTQPTGTATGLLDPAVGQRLNALKFDMEELQLAFNQCKGHSLAVEAATK